MEESRHFVVLFACDFQALLRHEGKPRRSAARFSSRRRRNSFVDSLQGMARLAAQYFGQTRGGLAREPRRDVRSELGALKSPGAER